MKQLRVASIDFCLLIVVGIVGRHSSGQGLVWNSFGGRISWDSGDTEIAGGQSDAQDFAFGLARFTRTLGTLISCPVLPILEGLD